MIVHKYKQSIYIQWQDKYYRLRDYHLTLGIPNTEYSYSHYTSLPLFEQLNDKIEDILFFGDFCVVVINDPLRDRFIFAYEEVSDERIFELCL